MDEKIYSKIKNAALKENAEEKNDFIGDKEKTVSNILDTHIAPKKKTEEEIRLDILETSSNNANNIYSAITKEEEDKRAHRHKFINFFKTLLIWSLVVILILIILSSCGILHIPLQVFVCLFVYIIANIFSILYIMVKYINNNQYLELFKTVTSTMLTYLIEDKQSKSNNKSTEEILKK